MIKRIREWLKARREAKLGDLDRWKRIMEARGEAAAPNVHGEPAYWGDLSSGDDITRWRQIIDERVETKLRAERRKEARSNGKKKLAYAALALALVAGTAGAAITFRSAIPFGTAASWSAATGSDSSATQGPWWSSANVQHFLIHDPSDNGDHDTYPIVNVADYPGASDDARLDAAIAATPINATLRVTKSLSLASNHTINKSMAVIVEANTSITLTSATISITANNVTIRGRGPTSSIVQGAANTNLFTATSISGLFVADIAFTGVAGTAPTSSNSAFKLTTCTDVTITRNSFTNFQHYSIWTLGNTTARVAVNDNAFVGGLAYLDQGGAGFLFSRNTVRDPQFATTNFVVPLQWDSTSSGFNAASDISIVGNTFLNWPQSQAILLHSGSRFEVIGNEGYNVLDCVSVSPFQAGDAVADGTISGNTCIGATSSGVATSTANYGIFAGGLSGQTAARIAITGNHVYGFNVWGQNDAWGCIAVGWADDILIASNEVSHCVGNGITLNSTNNRIGVIGNHINATQDTSPDLVKVGVGVWTATAQTGFISGNYIDTARQGVRLDQNTSGGVVVGFNAYTNVTTAVLNPTNGLSTTNTAAGSIQVPVGQGIDTNGAGILALGTSNATTVQFGNSAATTITENTSSTNGTIQLNGALQCRSNAIAQSTSSMTLNAAVGCNPVVTLTASVTSVSLTNFPLGQRYCVTFVQGGAGSFTISGWPSNVKWLPSTYRGTTHTAPTLTTTVGARDTICWIHDGTNLVQVAENLNN